MKAKPKELKSTGINYVRQNQRMATYAIRASVADDVRLRILHVLLKVGPQSQTDLEKRLCLSRGVIGVRLTQLRQAGMAVVELASENTRRRFHRLVPKYRPYVAQVMAWEAQFGNTALLADLPVEGPIVTSEEGNPILAFREPESTPQSIAPPLT